MISRRDAPVLVVAAIGKFFRVVDGVVKK